MADRPLVLVDGAAGFVGRHVVAELAARGWRVRATDRTGPALDALAALHVETVGGDLGTLPLAPLLDGARAVVHVAGLFDLEASRARLDAANIDLTARVARAAAAAGVERFVQTSSVTVYGLPRGVAAEDAPVRPRNPYERSKAAAERALRRIVDETGLATVVVRPSGIYGPGGTNGVALTAAMYAMAKVRGIDDRIPAYVGGPQFQHAHVRDVAGAIGHLLAAPEAVGRAFNVADATPWRWGELMAALRQWFGFHPGPAQELSARGARWMARLNRWLPARSRARRNASLAFHWQHVVEQFGLQGPLVPRLDRHAFDYWAGDHLYDVSALLGTGYELRYPDPAVGLRQTMQWYVDRGWLPPVGEFAPADR